MIDYAVAIVCRMVAIGISVRVRLQFHLTPDEFHFMTDKFHFMTDKFHFMTEPTAPPLWVPS
jgi:hypothetical protein